MKFKAPEHVTAIMAVGEHIRADVDSGIAELSDDQAKCEPLVSAMLAAGWTKLEAEVPKSKPLAPPPPPPAQ